VVEVLKPQGVRERTNVSDESHFSYPAPKNLPDLTLMNLNK